MKPTILLNIIVFVSFVILNIISKGWVHFYWVNYKTTALFYLKQSEMWFIIPTSVELTELVSVLKEASQTAKKNVPFGIYSLLLLNRTLQSHDPYTKVIVT